jgi:hypothetical protein
MLPNPSPNYQDHPETANAALFTFSLDKSADAVPAMTFGIQQPGQNSETKITVKPFLQINRVGTIAVWPTFNLYQKSKMFLYRSASAKAQCSNSVASVYTTSQPRNVPPFSGGIWEVKNMGAEGCKAWTETSVNWGDGNKDGGYAQNVYLSKDFPQ